MDAGAAGLPQIVSLSQRRFALEASLLVSGHYKPREIRPELAINYKSLIDEAFASIGLSCGDQRPASANLIGDEVAAHQIDSDGRAVRRPQGE
jgi:hypothetical protein